MPIDVLALLKSAAPKAVAYAKDLLKDWRSKAKARTEAIAGKDLTSTGTLEHLVSEQLKNLAASTKLPLELQGQSFRTWLLSDDAPAPFAEALVVRAGGNPEASRRAHERLALQYEQTMGEAKQLAAGPISLVVADLYGQLTATDANRAKYNAALARRTAAHTEVLRHAEVRPFPTDEDLDRLRVVAAAMLKAGRTTWKMPAFVAPLTLEAYEEKEGKSQNEKEVRSVSQNELFEAARRGESLVLYGDGGIGKTTFMLELVTSMADADGSRIVLYIDAALWAQSGLSVLDYIAANPAARMSSVTADELAKFAYRGQLALALNGWNEIPADGKVACREQLVQLTSAAPAMSVVVTSRTSQDTPSLARPRRVAVRGLTWQGQVDVIRSELPDKATSLVEMLARDTRLRHAARSPLILRGLVERARVGADPTADSVYDLLGAVVSTFEADERRGITLGKAPVLGMQERYLEQLASAMYLRRATNLSRDESLAALGTAAALLVQERLIGPSPHPQEVLEVLASHHLLHFQDNSVRFAHQRFQEYFAATLLLRDLNAAEAPALLLSQAINEPVWADSLELVAGKLQQQPAPSDARVRLVSASEALDLSYACELVGACSFTNSDDVALHDRLVAGVQKLTGSPDNRVRDLAVACQIASQLPSFADSLWSLLESDDQQVRLNSHRLNGDCLSLHQLGAGAESRIKAWPPEQRSEFLHEIAPNPANYDFVVRIATSEAEPSVRAAAIEALFWHYPASEAATSAWLAAPFDVQTLNGLANHLDDAAEQSIQKDAIRERLKAIAASDTPAEIRLSLAMRFPDIVGLLSVDVVLERLRTSERYGGPEPLIAIARSHAPARLLELAIELAGSPLGFPDWAGELLRTESESIRATAFELAWNALSAEPPRRIACKEVGPLSTPAQTHRSVDRWLAYRANRGGALTPVEQNQYYEIGYLLAHAPGEELFCIVMELAVDASYEVCTDLLELVRVRVSNSDDDRSRDNPWEMSPEQFQALFDLTSRKPEGAQLATDSAFAYLACIASYVAPGRYGSILLEAFRRQLDVLSGHQAATEAWMKNPVGPRHINPSHGGLVINALVRWGIEAVPGILELGSHQSASKLVPEALVRLTTMQWLALEKNRFSRSIGMDAEQGKVRRSEGRAFLQPSPEFQQSTDAAAEALAALLNAEIDRQLSEQAANPKWNVRQAEFQVGRLAAQLSSIPSPASLAAVIRALSSGLLEHYSFVDALRNLVRQGWPFSEPTVIQNLERLQAQTAASQWLDDSTRHAVANLCELALLVEPPTLLELPLSHYVEEWRKFAHFSDVIKGMASLKTDEVWPLLVALCKDVAATGNLPEDIGYTLASALTQKNFPDFVTMIGDGTLFAWCSSVWNLERIAQPVAAAAASSPEYRTLFIEAWRRASSPLADALLAGVLPKLGASDEELIGLGLEAFDAGRENPGMPAYGMLRRLFSYKTSLSSDQYVVNAKSCNSLRVELYRRARGKGGAAPISRHLLASLELSRREGDRPNDEPRHPEMTDGRAWTQALSASG